MLTHDDKTFWQASSTFMLKNDEKHRKAPIDMALVKKITQGTHLVLKTGANFNHYSDQIEFSKIIPIAMIANHHCLLREGGVNHRNEMSCENEVKFLCMINDNPQCCAAKKNNAPFEYFFYLAFMGLMPRNLRKTSKSTTLKCLMIH